jgi:hypothetical protein
MGAERISNPQYIGNMSEKVKREFNWNSAKVWIKEHKPKITPKNLLRIGAGVGVGYGTVQIANEVMAKAQKPAEVASVPSSVTEDLNYLHSFDNVNGNSGAIWTRYSCDNPQDANHYSIGQDVFVKGEGFDSQETFDVFDTGQPGGASGDPNIEVARKSVTTDGEGSFCIDLYKVKPDDWGEYTVDTSHVGGSKNDNYRVEGVAATNTPTPRFTATSTETPRASETPTNTATVTSTVPPSATAETSTPTPKFTATTTEAIPTLKSATPASTETYVCPPCPTCPPIQETTTICNPCEALETQAAALASKVPPEQTMAAAEATMASANATEAYIDSENFNRQVQEKLDALNTPTLNVVTANQLGINNLQQINDDDHLRDYVTGGIAATVLLGIGAVGSKLLSKKRNSEVDKSEDNSKKK